MALNMTITLGPAEILNGQGVFTAVMALAALHVGESDPMPTAREVANSLINEALDETAAANAEEGKKRTRRTKAQIEADEAAAKLAQGSGIALVSTAPRDTSMDTGAISSEQLAKAVAEVKAVEDKPKITKELITETALNFTTENPLRKAEFYAVRDSFKISKLSQLTPDQYEAFYAKLMALKAPAASSAPSDEL